MACLEYNSSEIAEQCSAAVKVKWSHWSERTLFRGCVCVCVCVSVGEYIVACSPDSI